MEFTSQNLKLISLNLMEDIKRFSFLKLQKKIFQVFIKKREFIGLKLIRLKVLILSKKNIKKKKITHIENILANKELGIIISI